MDRDPLDPRNDGAPLGVERDRFLCHITKQGFSIRTAYLYAMHIKEAVAEPELADNRSLSRKEVDAIADRWLSRQVNSGRLKGTNFSRHTFCRAILLWLEFQGRLRQPTRSLPTWEEMVREHGRWMEQERGFSPMTIRTRRQVVERFFRWCDARGQRLASIGPEVIDSFLQAIGPRIARCTLLGITDALYSFFQFGAYSGWYPKNLHESILRPKYWRESGLPRSIAWADVERLVESVRSATPRDVRDRAVLLVLSTYALRRSEIAMLRVDDIDWKRRQLTVRRAKVGRTSVFPLAKPVSAALRRYIENVRPKTERPELFWNLRPPMRPFLARTVTGIVERRMSEIGLAERYIKAHAIRYACATRLLEKGCSLKEIGDYLGHRNPDSTRIYAKVDLNSLRKVAAFDTGGFK